MINHQRSDKYPCSLLLLLLLLMLLLLLKIDKADAAPQRLMTSLVSQIINIPKQTMKFFARYVSELLIAVSLDKRFAYIYIYLPHVKRLDRIWWHVEDFCGGLYGSRSVIVVAWAAVCGVVGWSRSSTTTTTSVCASVVAVGCRVGRCRCCW